MLKFWRWFTSPESAPSPATGTRPEVHGVTLDPNGFNELKQCRSGPMVYNRFDVYVGGALQKYGEFSVGELDIFSELIEEGMLVVDAGANIGAHTVEFARLVGPKGTVYAFEPQRLVFQTLCANLAINQLTNVFARQVAVGNISGTIKVPDFHPGKIANFGGVALGAYEKGEDVPLIRLDDLELPQCNFIKVDIEGMEVDFLLGAEKTIRTHRPILFVENDRDENSADLIQLLFDLNYDLYWHLATIFRPGNFFGAVENIFPGVKSVNMLCVPKENPLVVGNLHRVMTTSENSKLALSRGTGG